MRLRRAALWFPTRFFRFNSALLASRAKESLAEQDKPKFRSHRFRRLEEEGTGSLPSTFLFRMNSCGGHTQTPWPQSSVKSVQFYSEEFRSCGLPLIFGFWDKSTSTGGKRKGSPKAAMPSVQAPLPARISRAEVRPSRILLAAPQLCEPG